MRYSQKTSCNTSLGSKVCGKNGFVDKGNDANDYRSIAKRQDIDLDSLHKDLHPERTKDQVETPGTVIKDKENAPAVVASKTDKERGWFGRLNRCCIDHENCDKFIAAKSERFGFKNEKDYTIYDCKCDDSFAECLKYADSHTADAVGDLYFNVLKMPCINFGDSANDTSTDDKLMEKVDKLVEERLKEKEAEKEKETEKERENKQENESDNGNEGGNKQEKENNGKDNDPTERQAIHFKGNTH